MPRQTLSEQTQGVFPIAATPFTAEGALDFDSLETLMEYYLRCGAQGITLLGVMGEASKLTESEAFAVVERALGFVAGRAPVVVGVSAASLPSSVALARFSRERGAAGVMLQPMPGLREAPAIVAYFTEAARRFGADLPILVQDYPTASGVHLSPDTWRALVGAIPQIVALKHEDMPGLQKLSAIRALEREGLRRVAILVGNNALHWPQELARGVDGAMTGLAFPDLLVRIVALFRAGRVDEAEDLHDAYLPLIRHEGQLAFGLAVRKEMLRLRGAIRCSAARYPAVRLTEQDQAELRRLLERLERRIPGWSATRLG